MIINQIFQYLKDTIMQLMRIFKNLNQLNSKHNQAIKNLI